MANEHIATYLNDHLAGSVAALELLAHLEAAHEGTPLEGFLIALQADIAEDKEELESLMKRLNVSESLPRKASAWIAGKMTELKLRLDDSAGGDLHLFESLEALSLGIEGKLSLWRSLISASEISPALRIADYERLARRAVEQRSRVEAVRLEAAKKALTTED